MSKDLGFEIQMAVSQDDAIDKATGRLQRVAAALSAAE